MISKISEQPKDVRHRERFEFKNNILCFKCKQKDQILTTKVPFLFNIIDISYGGLGISCNQRLNIESILTFNFKSQFDLRELNVEVKWCKFVNGKYRCGVHFVDLTYDDVIFLNQVVQSAK